MERDKYTVSSLTEMVYISFARNDDADGISLLWIGQHHHLDKH